MAAAAALAGSSNEREGVGGWVHRREKREGCAMTRSLFGAHCMHQTGPSNMPPIKPRGHRLDHTRREKEGYPSVRIRE